MKPDIQSREDLMLLVKQFYEKLLGDATISYVFTDVAKTELDHHLPVLVDFWDMVLFQSDTYHQNAMHLHMQLHQKSPFTAQHFKTWLHYFKTTVDELFEGEKAFTAKERATSISTMMQIKMVQTPNN
jgi:hemoglobin